jgi:hypothetical protein
MKNVELISHWFDGPPSIIWISEPPSPVDTSLGLCRATFDTNTAAKPQSLPSHVDTTPKSRSLPSHYRAPTENKASVYTEPQSIPRQCLGLFRALTEHQALVSTEPRSIPRQSLVLCGAPTEHQASVCRWVYAVIFSVSAFAVCLTRFGTLFGRAVMPCWASLVLSTDDCMSTVRIGVLSLSQTVPQVSVSTEQKSWSLPSKSLCLYCAKVSSISTKQESRSLPSPQSLPNPRFGSLSSMTAHFSESTFASKSMEVSNCDITDC